MDHADRAVVEQICAGDTAAFAVIMRRYNQRLYRAARAIVRDDAEAEDVLQEAYLRAFKHLPSFRHEAQLSTWLTRIVVHEACTRLRLRRRRYGDALEDLERETVTTPERCAYDDELRHGLEAAIDGLPARLRVVFVLRAVQGLSTAETARAVGISIASVKVRLLRARSALQRALSGRFESSSGDAFVFLGVRCAGMVAGVLARLG
jgi:RNA polymerase sigma-70 factor (ECF subfamily)